MRTEMAAVRMKTKQTTANKFDIFLHCDTNILKFAGSSTFEERDIPFWPWWLMINRILPVQLILPSPLNPPLHVQL